MEFDWSLVPTLSEQNRQQIEECFEDPFNLKLMPEEPLAKDHHRFFCLGKDTAQNGWFVVYTTNGKQHRILTARPLSESENHYYERKLREVL
ncbi:MAG: hypothetical protein R3F23_05655 [Verrucomicrobiia bacterium]